MDNFLEEISIKAKKAKKGLLREIGDIENSAMQNATFVQRKVLIRQKISTSQEEAKRFNLSTEEGIKNTEDFFLMSKRIETWLTL